MKGGLVMKLIALVESKWFTNFILALILINAILIGAETYPNLYNQYTALFKMADTILLTLFSIEIILKLSVYKLDYFKSGWNLVDFSVVALSLLFMGTNFVSVLRIVRVLRVLRTITAFPSLRRMVQALFLSFPAMGSTFLLLVIIFYIYAIIGTTFFGEISPIFFGSLQDSLLTLFQVFTLEAWASEVFRPIFIEMSWSWMYFASFIIISAFVVANIFFGELLNNAQKISEEIEKETAMLEGEFVDIEKEVLHLKEQNQQLHQKLDHLTLLLEKQKI